jgi:hypothetical protein
MSGWTKGITEKPRGFNHILAGDSGSQVRCETEIFKVVCLGKAKNANRKPIRMRTTGVPGKAALARTHSKTCRTLARFM